MRQIVLDTETTGLKISDGHRIIEFGCVELINRKFTGNKFHRYLNPEREIDEGALAVHGITADFLLDKPTFSQVVAEFIDFVSGAELIIHNAPFDVGFINYELQLLNNKFKPLKEYCKIIDTLVLAKQLHVGQRNNLDALCKRYSIDNSQRELHGALLDAHLLARVYLAMTGGQGSLFDELITSENTIQAAQDITVSRRNMGNLLILKASPEELALHEEKMRNMEKKGKCLWTIPLS